MFWFPLAEAAEIPVSTTAEPGVADMDCSLSEAITSALNDAAVGGCAAGSGDDVLDLSTLSGTITLVGELPALAGTIEVRGPGASTLTISGAGSFPILHTANTGAHVTVSGLSLEDGFFALPGGAALYLDQQDTAVLRDCALRSNGSSGQGSAIYARGDLTLERVLIEFNVNYGSIGGGAIASDGALRVVDSTIARNNADRDGGGLLVSTGTAVLVNTTVSGNSARNGAGIAVLARGTVAPRVDLIASTVYGNHATSGTGGGLRVGGDGATATLRSTILAGNDALNGADCAAGDGGSAASGGYNFVGTDDGCAGAFASDGDVFGGATAADPLLAGLDEGGPTVLTHRPEAGSPVLDAVPAELCTDDLSQPLAADARGFPRPAESDGATPAACEIGAHEVGCGDGALDGGEGCDDGNRVPGDGCDADCASELPPETTPPTTDTGSATTQQSPPTTEPAPGCTCSTAGGTPGLLVGGLLLWAARRRSRR